MSPSSPLLAILLKWCLCFSPLFFHKPSDTFKMWDKLSFLYSKPSICFPNQSPYMMYKYPTQTTLYPTLSLRPHCLLPSPFLPPAQPFCPFCCSPDIPCISCLKAFSLVYPFAWEAPSSDIWIACSLSSFRFLILTYNSPHSTPNSLPCFGSFLHSIYDHIPYTLLTYVLVHLITRLLAQWKKKLLSILFTDRIPELQEYLMNSSNSINIYWMN